MTPEEVTRKASRRRMIEQSKPDIDYDQLHRQRLELGVSGGQMEGGWSPSAKAKAKVITYTWWRIPLSASRNHEARVLLWLVGVSFVVIMTIIVIGVFYFS
jgi:hypothetical protein